MITLMIFALCSANIQPVIGTQSSFCLLVFFAEWNCVSMQLYFFLGMFIYFLFFYFFLNFTLWGQLWAVPLLTSHVLASYHLLRFLCLPRRLFSKTLHQLDAFTWKVWLVEFKLNKPRKNKSKQKKNLQITSQIEQTNRVLDKQLNKGSGYRINRVIQTFYSSKLFLKAIILAPMLTDRLICREEHLPKQEDHQPAASRRRLEVRAKPAGGQKAIKTTSK